MPSIPDDAKKNINSEFVRRLEKTDPERVDILVETQPGNAEAVAQQLLNVGGIRLNSAGVFGGKYIPLNVPEDSIPDIARVDGVELVHQDQQAGVMETGTTLEKLPGPLGDGDPIRTAISQDLFEGVTPDNPYVGSIRIGDVEVPRFNFAQLPPGDPFETLNTIAGKIAGEGLSGEKILPSSQSVAWIRDSDLTDGAISPDTKVSIIDTGHTPTEPENRGRLPHLESMVPGEPPLDMMGHGVFCTNTVTGYPAPGIWGTVRGVAPGSNYGHFKALNTFPGFGRSSWIIRAMDRSLEWGADVISMSLGGTQQGPVGEDPYARFIRDNCKENAGDEDGAIFVVAAGNAGPSRWTIGSPGVAPKALTVGSWSLTDEAPAIFSSRGPQGDYYNNNGGNFSDDLSRFGAEEFVKPDVAAPGGGRKNEALASQADELLFQTLTGWYDGLKDGLKDNRGNMKGTSMATPHVAGLVKRLYDAGIVQTASEVKQVVRNRATVGDFPDAAPNADATVSGKNIAIGFGPIRESLYEP